MGRKGRKPGGNGNGEGCISKRKNKDGKVTGWCAVITSGINPKNGKQKQVFMYGKTREEVADKLLKARGEQKEGINIDPNKLTVAGWMDKWLKERMKNHLRPTTWSSYKYLTETHIVPALGTTQLKKLTSTKLHDLYNEKVNNGREDGTGGLSGRTVRYIHTVIHAALKQAVREGILSQNVADNVVLPKQEKKEMRVLSQEEVDQFLVVAEKERLYTAFLLDLDSGLRVGELLALRWKDIDLKNAIVHVERGIVRIRDQEGEVKTKLIFNEPKTKHGKREIPIPEDTLKELKLHKDRQDNEKFLVDGLEANLIIRIPNRGNVAGTFGHRVRPGDCYSSLSKQYKVSVQDIFAANPERKLKRQQVYEDTDLVFCTQEGRPVDPRNFTRTFHSLIDKAKVPHANLHSLRHTYATRQLEAGSNPKIVQELLGHANISLTLDTYSHVSMDLKKEAVARMEALTKRKPSKVEGQ
ncbi:MAG: tyrosine-type recombinase/integrase [Bacillota bacterium]